jgi:hypothetical protein
MSLQSHPSSSNVTRLVSSLTSKKALIISEQLERLRVTLGMDDHQWAQILDVSTDDYADIRKNMKSVSIIALARVADHLQLTLDGIMNNRIDYSIVAARQNGNVHLLPERYQVGARSRQRSSLNLLNATEEFLGWRARAMVMRHLQVTEATFSNPDDLINLRFNTDLCEYINKNYSGSHLFYHMGAYSVISNMNSPFAKIMSQMKSLPDLYQFYVEEMVVKHWEQNYNYRITNMTATSCRIESTPNNDVAAVLGVRNPGSHLVCQTKLGVSASVPGYLGLPFANARETSCVHLGDSSCVQEIDFELAAHQLARTEKNKVTLA